MQIGGWLVGVAALACGGQAEAVTYYHFTVDFTTSIASSAPVTGAVQVVDSGTHVVLNYTSESPELYDVFGQTRTDFVANNTIVHLGYDTAALNASTSASPISSLFFSLLPMVTSRDVATIRSFSHSAYASATPTGPLGISTTITTSVPEPASWAMMIVGFGLVGSGMRYRRPRAEVRFA